MSEFLIGVIVGCIAGMVIEVYINNKNQKR